MIFAHHFIFRLFPNKWTTKFLIYFLMILQNRDAFPSILMLLYKLRLTCWRNTDLPKKTGCCFVLYFCQEDRQFQLDFQLEILNPDLRSLMIHFHLVFLNEAFQILFGWLKGKKRKQRTNFFQIIANISRIGLMVLFTHMPDMFLVCYYPNFNIMYSQFVINEL